MKTFAVAVLLAGLGLGLPACSAYSGEMQDATRTYLLQAQQAVRAHDAQGAIAALDQAEGAWLTATEARPNPVVHHDRPALRQIGLARSAVQTQQWGAADSGINAALHLSSSGDATG